MIRRQIPLKMKTCVKIFKNDTHRSCTIITSVDKTKSKLFITQCNRTRNQMTNSSWHLRSITYEVTLEHI